MYMYMYMYIISTLLLPVTGTLCVLCGVQGEANEETVRDVSNTV
jgi:hypothetical protein